MTINNITLTTDGIAINAPYYAIINGYSYTKQEQFYIEYRNLLAVDRVRRRSKKVFFAFILFGSLLIAIVPTISRWLRIANQLNITDSIPNILGSMVALCVVCLIALALSNRPYIQFTFLGGVIRVPCGSINKTEMTRLISEIHNRKK